MSYKTKKKVTESVIILKIRINVNNFVKILKKKTQYNLKIIKI